MKRTIGRVFGTWQQRFWAYVVETSDCWQWRGGTNDSGYGQVTIRRGYIERAHRLSWWMFHGEIPPGMCVCHKCDNRTCVRPDHLFLGTKGDNTRDMLRKGRHSVGVSQPRAKLTNDTVRWIRVMAASRAMSQRAIAQSVGCSEALVSMVARGLKWAHVA